MSGSQFSLTDYSIKKLGANRYQIRLAGSIRDDRSAQKVRTILTDIDYQRYPVLRLSILQNIDTAVTAYLIVPREFESYLKDITDKLKRKRGWEIELAELKQDSRYALTDNRDPKQIEHLKRLFKLIVQLVRTDRELSRKFGSRIRDLKRQLIAYLASQSAAESDTQSHDSNDDAIEYESTPAVYRVTVKADTAIDIKQVDSKLIGLAWNLFNQIEDELVSEYRDTVLANSIDLIKQLLQSASHRSNTTSFESNDAQCATETENREHIIESEANPIEPKPNTQSQTTTAINLLTDIDQLIVDLVLGVCDHYTDKLAESSATQDREQQQLLHQLVSTIDSLRLLSAQLYDFTSQSNILIYEHLVPRYENRISSRFDIRRLLYTARAIRYYIRYQLNRYRSAVSLLKRYLQANADLLAILQQITAISNEIQTKQTEIQSQNNSESDQLNQLCEQLKQHLKSEQISYEQIIDLFDQHNELIQSDSRIQQLRSIIETRYTLQQQTDSNRSAHTDTDLPLSELLTVWYAVELITNSFEQIRQHLESLEHVVDSRSIYIDPDNRMLIRGQQQIVAPTRSYNTADMLIQQQRSQIQPRPTNAARPIQHSSDNRNDYQIPNLTATTANLDGLTKPPVIDVDYEQAEQQVLQQLRSNPTAYIANDQVPFNMNSRINHARTATASRQHLTASTMRPLPTQQSQALNRTDIDLNRNTKQQASQNRELFEQPKPSISMEDLDPETRKRLETYMNYMQSDSSKSSANHELDPYQQKQINLLEQLAKRL